MKKLWLLTALLPAALILFSCSNPAASSSSSSSTTYQNSVLPSNLMVKLPASLSSSSSSGSAMARSTSGSGSSSTQSAGYALIKSELSSMGSMEGAVGEFGFVVDAAISQNNLSPGVHANVNVTLTQAIYNAMAAQLPASELPPTADIGQTETIPSLDYETNGTGTLADSAVFSITSSGTTLTMTYKWNTARNQILMEIQSSGMTVKIADDATDNSGAFYLSDGSTNTYSMEVKEDPNSTAEGVWVDISSTDSGSYTISGYGDNNGGMVDTTMTPSTSGTTTTYYYEEGFDGSGNLLLQRYSYTNPASGTPSWQYTVGSSSTPVLTTYDSKASNATTENYGAYALLSD